MWRHALLAYSNLSMRLSDAELLLDALDFGGCVAVAAVIIGSVGHLVLNLNIEFDFRLRTRGADRYL